MVKTEYAKALDYISEFAEMFIDTAKREWLVKAIMELIESDQSIPDTDVLYIRADGKPLWKAAIRTLEEICLQPFLLGVWHYILMNRSDNAVGRDTYEQWHEEPDTKGKRWRFISRIGETIKQPVNITMLGNETKETSAEQAAKDEENDEPHVHDAANSSSAEEVNQYPCGPIIFQYGNNNVQIGSIDSLIINNG